jgi:hypothetical protein
MDTPEHQSHDEDHEEGQEDEGQQSGATFALTGMALFPVH